MTEQPAEPAPPHDGKDHATKEQRINRAMYANDIANAMITSRNDMRTAANLIENAINTQSPDGHIDPGETIRMLANVALTFTSRIAMYADELDHRADDPDYFTKKHARIIMSQTVNPVIERITPKGKPES